MQQQTVFKSTTSSEMRYAVMATIGELALEKGAENKMVGFYQILKGLRQRFPGSEITKPDIESAIDVMISGGFVRYFEFDSNNPAQGRVRVYGVSKKGWAILRQKQQGV